MLNYIVFVRSQEDAKLWEIYAESRQYHQAMAYKREAIKGHGSTNVKFTLEQ